MLVKYKSSTTNSITLAILPQKQLKRNAELIIQVFQKSQKLQTHQMQIPFLDQYTIEALEHQTIYDLKVRLENGQSNTFQTLHVHTSADPNQAIKQSNIQEKYPAEKNLLAFSEKQLIEVLDAEDEDINIFGSKQEIRRIIEKARKNSSASGFMRSEYKISRPPELREERFKRVWMISKGQQFYDEVYGNKNPGMQFLQNDWFMGPFYSYDKNEENLRKAKAKADLHIQQD